MPQSCFMPLETHQKPYIGFLCIYKHASQASLALQTVSKDVGFSFISGSATNSEFVLWCCERIHFVIIDHLIYTIRCGPTFDSLFTHMHHFWNGFVRSFVQIKRKLTKYEQRNQINFDAILAREIRVHTILLTTPYKWRLVEEKKK